MYHLQTSPIYGLSYSRCLYLYSGFDIGVLKQSSISSILHDSYGYLFNQLFQDDRSCLFDIL